MHQIAIVTKSEQTYYKLEMPIYNQIVCFQSTYHSQDWANR